MVKLGVSVDIEDWYHISPASGTRDSKFRSSEEFLENWKNDYDYLTEPTLRALDILDKFEITATIFIVANVVKNYPELVDAIKNRKHEIGCHGLSHESKLDHKTKEPRFTKLEFKTRTTIAKKILEETFKIRMVGYRAPNAYVGGWMVDALEEIGFEYDSSVSVNSLYNKTDSNLCGVTTAPYFPEKGKLTAGKELRNIVEIPFSHGNILGIRVPTGGGPLLRIFGANFLTLGIKQSLSRGSTVFYFHPIDISYRNFPYLSPAYRLFWLVKGEKVERYITAIFREMKKSDIDMVPLREIAGEHMQFTREEDGS